MVEPNGDFFMLLAGKCAQITTHSVNPYIPFNAKAKLSSEPSFGRL